MRFTPAQQIGRQIAKLKNDGYSEEDEGIQKLRADQKVITDSYLESSRKAIEYPVHLFESKKTTHSKKDLLNVFDLIKSPNSRIISSNYEYHLKKAPECISDLTKNLKRYTPCGVFYTSSERIDIQKLNGILMLKTNGGQLTDKDKRKITSCSHTFAFYQQLVKDHYVILVKCKDITKRNYVDFQRYAEDYYHSLIGDVKLYAPVINERVFIAYDPKFYHNPDSIALNLI